MHNIRHNLFLTFIYITTGIPVAARVLNPFFGILLSPIFVAAAMALSSVSVIGNLFKGLLVIQKVIAIGITTHILFLNSWL